MSLIVGEFIEIIRMYLAINRYCQQFCGKTKKKQK